MNKKIEWIITKIKDAGFLAFLGLIISVPVLVLIAWVVFMFMVLTNNDGCVGEPNEPDPSDQWNP